MSSSVTYSAVARTESGTHVAQVRTLLQQYLLDLGILLTAYLVATYWREVLPFGRYVGTNYQWHSPELYLIIACGLAAAYALRILLQGSGRVKTQAHLRTLLAGIALACVALTIFLPYQSGLQKAYFAVLGFALAALVLARPGATSTEPGMSIAGSISRLWSNRSLLRIWVYYNVHSRYAQALLGVLWIVLLPLSTALIMSIVFSQIMRVQIHNVPFIAFFLAGMVPWGLFNQSIGGGMRSILSSMPLINQIYFPREIIVLSALGEAAVDTFFMFLAMLVIDAVVGIFPNPLFLLLPVLVLIQLAFSLGIMLVVSWLSVLIRDIPQLVNVLLQILFYLSPIIYPVTIIPNQYRFLVTLNPMAIIIEAYHQIIVYDRVPDMLSLVYPSAFAVALLLFGYRLFKSNEDRMADMV